MPQEREPAQSVIQGRLLKIIDACKRLDPKGALWLVAHACPSDLRDAAKAIEDKAKES